MFWNCLCTEPSPVGCTRTWECTCSGAVPAEDCVYHTSARKVLGVSTSDPLERALF